MKKQLKLVTILLIGLIHFACVDDFTIGNSHLQKPPGVDITIDTVFNSADYAQRFLWNTYSTLYYGMPYAWSAKGNAMNMGTFESMTDNWQSYLSWDYNNRNIYPGKYGATEESQHSKYHYSNEDSWIGIRKSYLFIENIDRTPGIDDATKKRLKAEAKMIIACHYSDMFRHFGGLPIVTKSYDPYAVPNIDRGTAKETLNFIVKLCNEAAVDLPWSLAPDEKATWDGRFTGAAAIGLKIRVLLFGASPLFNDTEPYYTDQQSESNTDLHTWYGGKDESMWQDVVDAGIQFFEKNEFDNNGGYALYNELEDPRLRYRAAYFERGTAEMLISTRVKYNHSYDEFFNYFTGPSAVPVLEYLDLFPNANGTPFDNSVWNDSVISPYRDPWADRDPRLYETCIVNGMTYQDRTAETWIGGRERGIAMDWSSYFTGAGNFKFGLDKKLASGKPAQWPYLRMAEIYLSFAEALNELGRTEEAFDYIDAVRKRVNLMGLKESYPSETWTKERFREEVLNERSREFGRELVRWFDLIRWKRAGDFKKRLHGLRIERMKDANGNVIAGKYKHFKFTLSKRFWQNDDNGTSNFSSKWYLSAFPITETYKDYKLPQNPGW